jgi:hypothetical protein
MATARRRKQVACASDAPLPPAVVRLYARALEIENEIEEAVADGDYMTNEELLAWSERSQTRLDPPFKNCIFYISRMYEFSHSQGHTRSVGDVCSMSGLPPESRPERFVTACRTSANWRPEQVQQIIAIIR